MKKLKNSGFNVGFVIACLAILIGVIASFFDPLSALAKAPGLNLFFSFLCLCAAVVWGYACYNDLVFAKVENHIMLQVIQIAVFFALLLLSLLIAGVFHSGALGTSGNPLEP